MLDDWKPFNPNSTKSVMTQFMTNLKLIKCLTIDWDRGQRAKHQQEILEIEDKIGFIQVIELVSF